MLEKKVLEAIRNIQLSPYEQKALIYAEKYGIIEYEVHGENMIYFESFPNEGTFKHVCNLKTGVESSETF